MSVSTLILPRDIRVVERKDATCLYWVVIVVLAAAIITVLFI